VGPDGLASRKPSRLLALREGPKRSKNGQNPLRQSPPCSGGPDCPVTHYDMLGSHMIVVSAPGFIPGCCETFAAPPRTAEVSRPLRTDVPPLHSWTWSLAMFHQHNPQRDSRAQTEMIIQTCRSSNATDLPQIGMGSRSLYAALASAFEEMNSGRETLTSKCEGVASGTGRIATRVTRRDPC
jgi:hypothetical protein